MLASPFWPSRQRFRNAAVSSAPPSPRRCARGAMAIAAGRLAAGASTAIRPSPGCAAAGTARRPGGRSARRRPPPPARAARRPGRRPRRPGRARRRARRRCGRAGRCAERRGALPGSGRGRPPRRRRRPGGRPTGGAGRAGGRASEDGEVAVMPPIPAGLCEPRLNAAEDRPKRRFQHAPPPPGGVSRCQVVPGGLHVLARIRAAPPGEAWRCEPLARRHGLTLNPTPRVAPLVRPGPGITRCGRCAAAPPRQRSRP